MYAFEGVMRHKIAEVEVQLQKVRFRFCTVTLLTLTKFHHFCILKPKIQTSD